MSALTDELLKQGLITGEQLADARSKQKGAKMPVQELLVEMGYVKEDDLIKTSAKVFNIPIFDLNNEVVDSAVIEKIPYEIAERYGVFPVRYEDGVLIVAMSDPQDIVALDDIRSVAQSQIKPVLCAKDGIHKSIGKYYQAEDIIYDILKNSSGDTDLKFVKEDKAVVASVKEDAPAVKLCNLIFADAVKARASDIHIEPQEKAINVRYRVDGDLRNVMEIPVGLKASIVARIKVLADLDIAETRKPQDGRIKVFLNGRNIDLRVSVIPVFYGEKVEVRVLDPQEAKIDLATIGFEEKDSAVYKETIAQPQGMVLVTGPTGSGKTTTLYATLNFIKNEKKHIITIEDPIEYLLDGINQMKVDPVKEVTFASGLRSILRQDPDVIFVGEVRDKDTADIAFRAALTGHVVFSTLHTNNSVASVTRLLDIGLEPAVIASSVIMIIAQRLVRIICPRCKEEYAPQNQALEDFQKYIAELKIEKFFRGRGCSECGFSGFLGRTAIFEILRVNEKIKSMIIEKASESQIANEAANNGLKTLVHSGMLKVAAGITTLEEIASVIGIREEEKVVQKSAKTGENLKILIADDEEDILRTLEKRLVTAGYEVIKARDGNEAVQRAHKDKPDLIIIDATMPKMGGFEAIKELRSRLETVAIPIIMLTGRQDKESELAGIDAGADDYIIKPFDAEKLLARIGMLLRRRARTS